MVTGEHEVPLTGACTGKRKNHVNNQLSIVRIFTALGIWGSFGVFSLYLNSFGLSESRIGYLFSIASVLAAFVYLFSPSILERFSKARIVSISIILMIGSYMLLGTSHTLSLFLIGFYAVYLLAIVKNLSFEILFRDNTSLKKLNKEEGRLMALRNIGVAVGPLIAGGLLLLTQSFLWVFVASAVALSISLILFVRIRLPRRVNRKEVIDDNVFTNIRAYIRAKPLRLPYLMSLGTGVWWTFIHVYIPLFMVAKGMSLWSVGLFLALVVVPLILLEEKTGSASAIYGFRAFFMIGFGGLFGVSILLFFIEPILIQLLVLTLGSVFAAFLGPLIHPFFFKQTKKKDEDRYYSIYGTSFVAGTFLGKFVIATALLYFSNQYAYLVMAALMAGCLLFASKIPKKLR